jgi:hypothetical protein
MIAAYCSEVVPYLAELPNRYRDVRAHVRY